MWAWYEGSWAVVELESSFIKFFWSACSKHTTSIKGAFPSKEKEILGPHDTYGCSVGSPSQNVSAAGDGAQRAQMLFQHLWSQPDVSDPHVTLWDRFLQAFASAGQKLSLLMAAQVDHMNFPHGCCCRNPVTAIPSISCCCLGSTYRCQCLAWKSGFLKHWIKIFTFLPMDLAIAKPMSISKSWGLKEQSTLGGIIGPSETG